MNNASFLATEYQKYKLKTQQELQSLSENGGKMILFGCGGHARSIVNVIRGLKENIEIILVDENATENELILGCQTFGEHAMGEKDVYIIAVGDNAKRKKLYAALNHVALGRCVSIVAPNAHIGIDAKIGNGTFVSTNAYIGPQAEIGKNTIINTCSVIEHEVKVGDNTHIAPNATVCGRSRIGNNVFCGAGSIIIDQINVCNDVVLGAGSVVRADIKEAGTYVGVPARKIK